MWTLLSEPMPLLRNDLIYMPSEWGHINIMHDLYQLYRCLNLRTFKLFESYSYLADWYSNWQFTAIQVYLRTQSSHKYCWAYPIVGYLLLPFNFLQLWGEDISLRVIYLTYPADTKSSLFPFYQWWTVLEMSNTGLFNPDQQTMWNIKVRVDRDRQGSLATSLAL